MIKKETFFTLPIQSVKNSHLLLLGLCLFLFTASATTDLALPGPHEDESYYPSIAIDLMRPPYPFGHYRLHLGDQPFPFGQSPHVGALEAYLQWPLFGLFGPSVPLARLFTISLGLLVLVFCYLFLSEHFGLWGAFCATLLLSLDSSFIFYSKLDAGPIVEKLLWMLICLWVFGRWVRVHRTRYLIAGILAGVFGIYSHIAFIWFTLACFGAGLLFYRDEIFRLCKRPAVYIVIPGTVCFFAIFFYWLIGDQILLSKGPPGFSGAFVMFERVSVLGGIIPDVLLGGYSRAIPILAFKTRPITDLFLFASTLFLICYYGKRSKFMRYLFFVAGIIFLEISWTPGDFVFLPHE